MSRQWRHISAFLQDTLFMFVFLDDVKSPSCFPSQASAVSRCSSLHPLMWTNTCANILQKLHQLHCHLSADIRCWEDRINIIINFMFRGKTEEFSEKCLFRLRLDAEPRLLRERGKPSPSFPQCWGKKYIPGLTSDPGLVLIYFSKLSSPPRSKYRRDRNAHGNPPWIQGKWFIRQNFCCHKRVSYWIGLHIFYKCWDEDLIQLFLQSRIFNLVH